MATEPRERPTAVSARAQAISPSATLAITAKANALKAQGLAVVGFGAGEPDYATPGHIVEAAVAAALDPRNHKYTPAAGLPDLRSAIAAKTSRDSGFEVDASQVIVTNGAKHAIYATCQVLIDPGDEVLLPAPYWVSYPEAVRLADGIPVVLPTDETSGYKVTVEDLEAARTHRTKMLIFVSPSNPTGSVYPRHEVAAIGRWAAQHDIWVMTDEIYEHLVYGDNQFSSLPVEVPEMADRTVLVNGVAKTYAMTGWRVGWMIAPPEVAAAAGRLQSHSTSNVSNVSQRAALAAVSGSLVDVARMRAAFDRRRRLTERMLNDIPGVVSPETQGAFYAFPSMKGVLGRSHHGTVIETTLDLAALALEEALVAFVPGEAFGSPGYARFSFALGDEDIERGLGNLAKFVASLD